MGPCGNDAGTLGGLCSLRAAYLRPSPRKRSLHGKCGQVPASSKRCTPTTACARQWLTMK